LEQDRKARSGALGLVVSQLRSHFMMPFTGLLTKKSSQKDQWLSWEVVSVEWGANGMAVPCCSETFYSK